MFKRDILEQSGRGRQGKFSPDPEHYVQGTTDHMKVIIIEDWQAFLCYWRSTTPCPDFKHPFPRHPQSYQNTCVWSQPMEDYLSGEGLRHTVVSDWYRYQRN